MRFGVSRVDGSARCPKCKHPTDLYWKTNSDDDFVSLRSAHRKLKFDNGYVICKNCAFVGVCNPTSDNISFDGDTLYLNLATIVQISLPPCNEWTPSAAAAATVTPPAATASKRGRITTRKRKALDEYNANDTNAVGILVSGTKHLPLARIFSPQSPELSRLDDSRFALADTIDAPMCPINLSSQPLPEGSFVMLRCVTQINEETLGFDYVFSVEETYPPLDSESKKNWRAPLAM